MIKNIPIKQAGYPNQQLNVNASGQSIVVNLKWLGYVNQGVEFQDYIDTYAPPSYYVSITCNNNAVINNNIMSLNTALNPYPSEYMGGYIVAINFDGEDSPSLDNLGTSVFLFYVDDLSEIANITKDLT